MKRYEFDILYFYEPDMHGDFLYSYGHFNHIPFSDVLQDISKQGWEIRYVEKCADNLKPQLRRADYIIWLQREIENTDE